MADLMPMPCAMTEQDFGGKEMTTNHLASARLGSNSMLHPPVPWDSSSLAGNVPETFSFGVRRCVAIRSTEEAWWWGPQSLSQLY